MTGKPPLLSIILPNLSGGGAERISINLANSLVEIGISVDMVLLSATGELLSDLNSKVRVIDLKSPRVRTAYWPLVAYLRRSKPTALLACMWPLTVLAVAARKFSNVAMRLLVAEHNTWSISQRDHRFWIRPLIRWSMRWCFPYTDGVIAVSNGAAQDIIRYANLKPEIVNMIYNPVTTSSHIDLIPLDQNQVSTLWGGSKFKIITIGSLKPQKNHALLLQAIASLVKRIDAHLVILGEGSLRNLLENLTVELNITDRVTLAGFKHDPYPYLKAADLFVLSSDWEGLPTVLIEALSVGTPVVSTDCPSGPREILKDGSLGRLVPTGNPQALSNAMEEALHSKHDIQALMARALDFSIDKAANRYLEVLLPNFSKSSDSYSAKADAT